MPDGEPKVYINPCRRFVRPSQTPNPPYNSDLSICRVFFVPPILSSTFPPMLPSVVKCFPILPSLLKGPPTLCAVPPMAPSSVAYVSLPSIISRNGRGCSGLRGRGLPTSELLADGALLIHCAGLLLLALTGGRPGGRRIVRHVIHCRDLFLPWLTVSSGTIVVLSLLSTVVLVFLYTGRHNA